MKILIPIAGNNMIDEKNQYIKSLYEIEKKTILQYVYESLNYIENAEFLIVLKREDTLRYHLDDMVRLLIPGVEVVVADRATQGAACSCLLAVDRISDEEALLIVGSDQLLNINLQEVIDDFEKRGLDGGVIVFDDIHPRWSFVRLDEDGYVVEAAEKRPISRYATTGFYYFRRGGDFIDAAEQMIKKGASVNGQYYVCPCYNEMILKQKKIGVFQISKEDYFNLNQQKGIDDYEAYLKKYAENIREEKA